MFRKIIDQACIPFLPVLIYFLPLSLSAQQEAIISQTGKKVLLFSNGTWQYADSLNRVLGTLKRIENLEIPKSNSKDFIIKHSAFALLYNEQHEQAAWVAYELTKDETIKAVERNNQFKPDPKVKTGSANDADYKNSGYDRGHLAPAADMAWSETSMDESFYYSNMSPQLPGFNRGIWKKLEELARNWAKDNEAVYVVSGPVLHNNLQTIGPNQVSVPEYYYKVILDYTWPETKAIGFILPNESSKLDLEDFAVSVDSVEKITGIDFFWLLPDEEETLLEKTICETCWTWGTQKRRITSESGNSQSDAKLCAGITKAGNPCKNKTNNSNGFCHHHQPESGNTTITGDENPQEQKRTVSVQCSGTTKAGNRCKRMTLSPSGRCFQH